MAHLEESVPEEPSYYDVFQLDSWPTRLEQCKMMRKFPQMKLMHKFLGLSRDDADQMLALTPGSNNIQYEQ